MQISEFKLCSKHLPTVLTVKMVPCCLSDHRYIGQHDHVHIPGRAKSGACPVFIVSITEIWQSKNYNEKRFMSWLFLELRVPCAQFNNNNKKKKNNTTQRSLLNCFKQFIRNKHVEETELMANIRDDGSSTNRHHYVGVSSNRFLWGETPSDLTWGSTSQPWYRGMSSRSNTMHSGVYSKTRTPVNFTLTSRPVCSLCSTAMASLMF